MKRQVEALLPTKYGDYTIIVYGDDETEVKPHFVLKHVDCDVSNPVTLRIHSECLTGDLLGSEKCDCGSQLESSLHVIDEKKGILIYLRQEGRGIGLINKLKAYKLQQEGYNTVDANVHLGFKPDERDYQIAINIAHDLGIKEVDLITNNPDKLAAFNDSGIALRNRIPINPVVTKENEEYLQVKRELMGHLFS